MNFGNDIFYGEATASKLAERIEHLDWLRCPLESVREHLNTCIEQFRPDIIVVLERKGRALLRGLIDEVHEKNLDWNWQDVISSNALSSVDRDYFRNKRILIFDDTLKTGGHIVELLEDLSEIEAVDPNSIGICVVGAHRDGSPTIDKLESEMIPVWCYFRNLATDDFHILRKALVDQIRHLGSLMLDTEHVEIRFKTEATFREVVDAVGRNAETLVFESGRNIRNITVYYGDSPQTALSEEDFPGCGFTRIVKKCRIIQYRENEYAIVPLCLPSVPVSGFLWKDESWMLKIFNLQQPRDMVEAFYQVGLIASLDILEWIVKDLSASLGERIIYKFPNRKRKQRSAGYDYYHLLPIYPSLCMDRIVACVSDRTRESEAKGARLSKKKALSTKRTMSWNEGRISGEQLEKDAVKLVQCIGEELQRRDAEFSFLSIPQKKRTIGLRAREVFELGINLGFTNVEVSALFDILIDNATLVTKIEVQRTRSGLRCVRTFKPDGEIVTALVAEYTREWGLPYEAAMK